jgi:hypothetical protein
MTVVGMGRDSRAGSGGAEPVGLGGSDELLLPVAIDRERDVGLYIEPNCWMVHLTG